PCCWRISLLLTISVERMETTAGITRAATSANDGIVTLVTGPDDVWICGAGCACELRIRPRSALMITPNATEAMTMAMVDKIRFVDAVMTIRTPPGNSERVEETERARAELRTVQRAPSTVSDVTMH